MLHFRSLTKVKFNRKWCTLYRTVACNRKIEAVACDKRQQNACRRQKTCHSVRRLGTMLVLKKLLMETCVLYSFQITFPVFLKISPSLCSCRNDVIHTLEINNIYTRQLLVLKHKRLFASTYIILAGSNFLGKATADISAPRSWSDIIFSRDMLAPKYVAKQVDISCWQLKVGTIAIFSMPK